MSSAQALLVVLMLRVASAGRARLGADLVDAGQAVQEAPQRRLVARRVVQRRDVAAEGAARESRSRPQCTSAAANHPTGRYATPRFRVTVRDRPGMPHSGGSHVNDFLARLHVLLRQRDTGPDDGRVRRSSSASSRSAILVALGALTGSIGGQISSVSSTDLGERYGCVFPKRGGRRATRHGQGLRAPPRCRIRRRASSRR